MADITKTQTFRKLQGLGLSDERAAQKAEHATAGYWFAVPGLLIGVIGAAIVAIVALKGGEVGVSLVIAIGLIMGMAALLLGIGLHLIARDAAPGILTGIADAGVKVIRALRGKNGST